MFHVILWQPEIPPNTGNIIRLCANTGATLSLVAPLGFELDEPRLRSVQASTITSLPWSGSTRGWKPASRRWGSPGPGLSRRARSGVSRRPEFAPGDALLFGPETRGLPPEILARFRLAERLVLPMRPGNRSLNLSNAVAVAVYEAWRQQGFTGASGRGGAPTPP
jgi:tRNA (cytidine/uridine-2'-O-)-methyltransferase